jgi:hypothetical protein
MADYEDNRSDAMVAAAEASRLLPPIEAVLAGAGFDVAGFEGTATELLKRLDEVCGGPSGSRDGIQRTHRNSAARLIGSRRYFAYAASNFVAIRWVGAATAGYCCAALLRRRTTNCGPAS